MVKTMFISIKGVGLSVSEKNFQKKVIYMGNDEIGKMANAVSIFREKMIEAGFDIPDSEHPIIPVMLYNAKLAQEMSSKLLDEGIYVIGFFYPVVPKEKARIRVQISAAHSKSDLDKAISAFITVGRELAVINNNVS